MVAANFDVVVPTAGRPSLGRLLAALEPQLTPFGARPIVVEDRERYGPAATRNRGWRRSRAEWIAFLDDDVVPPPDWAKRLAADLDGLPPAVAASQGRLRVPFNDRRQNDWERGVAGLADARWITADLAVRRRALEAIGGFDERFRRAYREDTDLALRLLAARWQIVRGRREAEHPVPPQPSARRSLSAQRGNADDVLMRALHGRHWRRWGGAPRGRLPRHLLTAGSLVGASLATATGRRGAALGLATTWLAASIELAAARIVPGPRDLREVARMAGTSAVLPLVASAWWAVGVARLPRLLARGGPRGSGERPPRERPRAVLLDRDGTLVFDVPYNGDPSRVAPVPGARQALARLREAGLPLAVVSNQSGVARGLIEPEQVAAVNVAAERLLGPIDHWLFCPHGPGEHCACRKPAPGMVLEAAARIGVPPERCVLIGDVAADVQAAQAAGAAAILVPTEQTEAEDVRRAAEVAPSIEAAVASLLAGDADD